MEENGMNKLIELLNEYVKQLGIGDYVGWHNEKTVRNSDYFLTKKFGFIKWLVDNDKIDNSKFYDKNILKGFMTLTNKEKADSIIMNLSIQEKPIDYLVSILK